MSVRLHTLGSVELLDEAGRPISRVLSQPKRLALVAYLAIARPHGFHRRDRLLGLFWPELDEARARAALRKSLYFLRQAVGPDVIQSRGDGEVGLDSNRLWCDARAFQSAIDEDRPREASDLYRGDLLSGFYVDGASPEFERWLDVERTRLRRSAAQAAWAVSGSEESGGDIPSAVDWARRAFELAPPDGVRLRSLLAMLDRAGDRAGALRAYEKFAEWLEAEYGAEPAPETIELIERIRARRESSSEIVEAAAVSPVRVVGQAFVDPALAEEVPPQSIRQKPARNRWHRAALVAGFLAVSALIPTLVALRGDSAPPLDSNLVAIAPFSVYDPGHEVWSEGIVDYLSRSLDNAGELRTLSPTTAVRAWPGRADVESAVIAGRRTGAGVVVFGSLMGIGEDSVRVNATVVDVAGRLVLSDVEIRGEPGRMDQLVDTLTVQVLRGLSATRRIGAMRHTSIGSRSMPALKAFLNGERALRLTAWDEARVHYERAVELDSTFALAHLRLGTSILFIDLGEKEEGWKHVLRAGDLNHGLSRHDSLLIEVANGMAAAGLERLPEDAPDEVALKAYRTALEMTRHYPEDAEAWFMLGRVRETFWDQLSDLTIEDVLLAYERAIESDPEYAPAYRFAMRYALEDGRVEVAREYARTYLSLNPPETSRELPLLIDRLLDSRTTEHRIDNLLAGMHSETLFKAWLQLWLLADSTELAIRVTRESSKREHDPRYWRTAAFIADRNLAAVLAYRGHLRESMEFAGTGYTTWWQPLMPEAAILGFVAPAIADSALGEWLEREQFDPRGLSFALWWWVERGDKASIERYLERGGWEAQGEAALALARGDTLGAIQHLEERRPAWDHPNHTTIYHARLLRALGRDREAFDVLMARFPNDWSLASRVVWILERARVADSVGERDQALRDYRFITKVWLYADPEFQPVVVEAWEAVARLED